MGTCEYDFAKDCSADKLFAVRTLNRRCGFGVSCTAAVKVYIAGYHIQFSRTLRTAIVNGVRLTQFPIIRPGKTVCFQIVVSLYGEHCLLKDKNHSLKVKEISQMTLIRMRGTQKMHDKSSKEEKKRNLYPVI